MEVGEKIDSGGFSVVYRGTWLGAPVAVKQWFDASATPEQRTAIQEEIMTLAVRPWLRAAASQIRSLARRAIAESVRCPQGLRHPNVLQFLGAHTGAPVVGAQGAGSLMVTELLPFNLSDVLYKMTTVDLLGGKGIEIALDIVRAFMYLHSRRPRVIHRCARSLLLPHSGRMGRVRCERVRRDIKPHNFLLDRAWKVKVCDFGLASCPKPEAGTPQYMAPELFDRSRPYTEKVDVLSLIHI